MMLEVRPPPAPDLPQLPRSPSLHAVPTTPVDRTGACRFLPYPRGLPRLTGGSASTTSLSRPAQASLALRPARSQPAQGGLLSRGFDSVSYPTKPLGSYHVLPTTTCVDPPSTGDLRRWGAPLTSGGLSEIVRGPEQTCPPCIYSCCNSNVAGIRFPQSSRAR